MTPTPSTPPSRRRLLQGLAAAVCLGAAPWALAAPYPEITWDDLMPADWDPTKPFRDLQKPDLRSDSDPRVQALYDRLRKVWDEAPTVPSMAGRQVKIPGYIVPLESGKNGIREFLLVPYFGACIHTPPPPANQIIHVRADPPVKGFKTMSAVWVSGTLGLERAGSAMGASGYSMQAAQVAAYTNK
ncbi:DUF3299 domain-containing protein [Piscinibacter sp.]|uniref:DUF3299 domain-containing protein n=1 Tax=Piscinibacter sp. TaxID=1903157 RepID=UPI0039E34BB6